MRLCERRLSSRYVEEIGPIVVAPCNDGYGKQTHTHKLYIDMAKARDMVKTRKSRNLAKALGELLSNYVTGRIPDRRWNWIMEVLDSGTLTGAQRLEYVTAVNRTVPGQV